MKASFRLVFAALAATVTLVGCTKEITPNFENDKVNPEGSRVIAVSFTPQTKTTLDGFQPKFEDGKDTVLISNTNALDTCVVSVKDNKATISTNLTGPLTAVYPYKAAKMNESNLNQIDTVLVSTEQSGKFADANICMAKMTSENDESLSFENKTALFCIKPAAGASPEYVEVSAEGFDIANDYPEGSTYTTCNTIHVAHINTDSVYVSILVPDGLKVNNLKFSDGTKEKAITTGAQAGEEIAAGTLYTVTNANWESTEADIPDGALKGVFSVSADKQVYFSQGNLVATIDVTGAPTAWKFATNQYDYLGASGANETIGNTTTSGTAGDIDLFGWSTSDNSGVSTTDNYGIKTSTSATGYSGTFYDWGKAIGDGNTWRTLSTAEWQYLFNSRSTTTNTGTTNARYAKATVDTIAGIILLPDTYTHPSGVAVLTNINTNNAAFTVNTYDVTAWEAMESAGAVFLPAAGDRDGSNVLNVGDSGYYWSSTAYDEKFAYSVYFLSDSVSPDYGGRRYRGYSVRLVTDVPAAPGPTEPDYVVITAKYDGEDQPARALKWATKNLAITDSGKKSWKGGNESAVKVPGTNEDVIVGDYFQWAASYGGYNVTENQEPDSLLIYTLFTNTGCGDDKNEFAFIGSKSFVKANAPYGGTSFTKYIDNTKSILERTPDNDDVASIILGGTWRMPTSVEFKALKDATYWKWEDGGYYVYDPQSDDAGKINDNGTGTYDKSNALLFFPAAGYGNFTGLNYAGTCGGYWSSTFKSSGMTNYAYRIEFNSDDVNPQYEGIRSYGFSVRPVSD